MEKILDKARKNGKGHVRLTRSEWTVAQFVALVAVEPHVQFECPLCDGDGRRMTHSSSCHLNGLIDDHGSAGNYEPTYKPCRGCAGAGAIRLDAITLFFASSCRRTKRGVDFLLRKESEEELDRGFEVKD